MGPSFLNQTPSTFKWQYTYTRSGHTAAGLCLFFFPWSLISANAILFLFNKGFMKMLVNEANSNFPIYVVLSILFYDSMSISEQCKET